MTTIVPALPPEGNTTWYPHYAALDAAVRELQTTVAALSAPAGLVFSVAGITPNPLTGDVPLGAGDVNALPATYTPGYGDLPLTKPDYVDKDPITGFWPSGYNADGSAIYTGGSASHGVRPHARLSAVIWRGADPSPDSVTSGLGGMLRGYDERAIPTP